MSQKQRVHLTLEKKVEVIKTAKKNRTLTYKALVKKLQEAIQALEEVKHFLDSRGCIAEATQASSLVDDLASLNTCATKTYNSLKDFEEYISLPQHAYFVKTSESLRTCTCSIECLQFRLLVVHE